MSFDADEEILQDFLVEAGEILRPPHRIAPRCEGTLGVVGLEVGELLAAGAVPESR